MWSADWGARPSFFSFPTSDNHLQTTPHSPQSPHQSCDAQAATVLTPFPQNEQTNERTMNEYLAHCVNDPTVHSTSYFPSQVPPQIPSQMPPQSPHWYPWPPGDHMGTTDCKMVTCGAIRWSPSRRTCAWEAGGTRGTGSPAARPKTSGGVGRASGNLHVPKPLQDGIRGLWKYRRGHRRAAHHCCATSALPETGGPASPGPRHGPPPARPRHRRLPGSCVLICLLSHRKSTRIACACFASAALSVSGLVDVT